MFACLLLLLLCFSSFPSSPFANPIRSPDLFTDSHSALKGTANQHLFGELHQRGRANAKFLLMVAHLPPFTTTPCSCILWYRDQYSPDLRRQKDNHTYIIPRSATVAKKPREPRPWATSCMGFTGRTHQGHVFCGLQLVAGMTDWCPCLSASIKAATAPHPIPAPSQLLASAS